VLADFGLGLADLPTMRMLDLSGGFADFAPADAAAHTMDAAGMARFSADWHATRAKALAASPAAALARLQNI
jgi:hypothetical protein